MRQLAIISILFRLRFSAASAHAKNSNRPRAEGWCPAPLFAASALIACERPQEPARTRTASSPALSSVASATPLPRFVPCDNLLFYFDCDGLDAHAEAWQNTAAFKMLSLTPLGVMLEEVAIQLLDRAMNQMHGGTLSGADVIRLVKMMAQKGFVLALSASQNSPNPFVGTLVLRGGSAQENKELKAKAIEKAAEEAARERASGAGRSVAPDRFSPAKTRRSGRVPTEAGKGPGSSGRSPRGRSPRQMPVPEFRLMPMQTKVDPTHLPKAEDLKALMFPGTLTVVADEQPIRLVTCESFPNPYASAATGAVALTLTLPAIQSAHARARGGPDVGPGGMAPGQLGPGWPVAGEGNFPGAVPRTEGMIAHTTDGASAPGPLSPLGRPAPGNHGPG